jgi:hypothetical protein
MRWKNASLYIFDLTVDYMIIMLDIVNCPPYYLYIEYSIVTNLTE